MHGPNLSKDDVLFITGDEVASLAKEFAIKHSYNHIIYRLDSDSLFASPVCNRIIVNQSDLVIAYWNSTSASTWHAIQTAEMLSKPIIVIDVDE